MPIAKAFGFDSSAQFLARARSARSLEASARVQSTFALLTQRKQVGALRAPWGALRSRGARV